MFTPKDLVLYDQFVLDTRPEKPELELHESSRRRQIVWAILDSALALLETRQGKESLAMVAERIITTRDKINKGRTKSRQEPHIYTDKLANLPRWIDRFLASMRDHFPLVLISTLTEGEAETKKKDWGSDMRMYVAADAGTLYLNHDIIANMGHAMDQRQAREERERQNSRTRSGAKGKKANDQPQEPDEYQLFKFQMVISVAHELVHFLTGFLTGTAKPNTPLAVTAEPYSTKDGEAGRFWEAQFLGGFVEYWAPELSEGDSPDTLRHPGRPYLFDEGSVSTALGYEVSSSYILDFLRGSRSLAPGHLWETEPFD